MKKILCLLIMTYVMLSCAKHKMISDKEMRDIMTQTLISDAIMGRENHKVGVANNIASDSIDIYAPILEKFGYDIADFNYTINTLAMRKNNPLSKILDSVVKDIEYYDAIASTRYKRMLKFDTLALDHYADTLFRRTKKIVGSLEKFKINIIPAKTGTYAIMFEYVALADSRVGTKSLSYDAVSRKYPKRSGTWWFNKRDTPQKFRNQIQLEANFDTLKFSFNDRELDAVLELKDTSAIWNLRVIYYPPTSKARKDYHNLLMGNISSIKEYYEKRLENYQDCLPIPFEPQKPYQKKRGDRGRLIGKDYKRRN